MMDPNNPQEPQLPRKETDIDLMNLSPEQTERLEGIGEARKRNRTIINRPKEEPGMLEATADWLLKDVVPGMGYGMEKMVASTHDLFVTDPNNLYEMETFKPTSTSGLMASEMLPYLVGFGAIGTAGRLTGLGAHIATKSKPVKFGLTLAKDAGASFLAGIDEGIVVNQPDPEEPYDPDADSWANRQKEKLAAAGEGVVLGALFDGVVRLGKGVIGLNPAKNTSTRVHEDTINAGVEENNGMALLKAAEVEAAAEIDLQKTLKEEGVDNYAELTPEGKKKYEEVLQNAELKLEDVTYESAVESLEKQQFSPINGAELPTQFLEELDRTVLSADAVPPSLDAETVKSMREVINDPQLYVELPPEVKKYLGGLEAGEAQSEEFYRKTMKGIADMVDTAEVREGTKIQDHIDQIDKTVAGLKAQRLIEVERAVEPLKAERKTYADKAAAKKTEATKMINDNAAARKKEIRDTVEDKAQRKKLLEQVDADTKAQKADLASKLKDARTRFEERYSKAKKDLQEGAAGEVNKQIDRQLAEKKILQARKRDTINQARRNAFAAASYVLNSMEIAALRTLNRFGNTTKTVLENISDPKELYRYAQEMRTTLSVARAIGAQKGRFTVKAIQESTELNAKSNAKNLYTRLAGTAEPSGRSIGSELDKLLLGSNMSAKALSDELSKLPDETALSTLNIKRETVTDLKTRSAQAAEALRDAEAILVEKRNNHARLQESGSAVDTSDALFEEIEAKADFDRASKDLEDLKTKTADAESDLKSFLESQDQSIREKQIANGDLVIPEQEAQKLKQAVKIFGNYIKESARRGDLAGGLDILEQALSRNKFGTIEELMNEIVSSGLLGLGSAKQAIAETQLVRFSRVLAGDSALDASTATSTLSKDEYLKSMKATRDAAQKKLDRLKERGRTKFDADYAEAAQELAKAEMYVARAAEDTRMSALNFSDSAVPFFLRLNAENSVYYSKLDSVRDVAKAVGHTAKVGLVGQEPLGTARRGAPRLSTSDVVTSQTKAGRGAAQVLTAGNRIMQAGDRIATYGYEMGMLVGSFAQLGMSPEAARKQAVKVMVSNISERTEIQAARRRLDALRQVDPEAALPDDGSVFSGMDYNALDQYEEMVNRRIRDLDTIKAQDLPDDLGQQRAKEKALKESALDQPMAETGLAFSLGKIAKTITGNIPVLRWFVPFIGTRASLGQKALDMTVGVHVANVERAINWSKELRGASPKTQTEMQKSSSRLLRMLHSHNAEDRIRAAFTLDASVKGQASILAALLMAKESRDPDEPEPWTGMLPASAAERAAWKEAGKSPTAFHVGNGDYVDISNIPGAKPIQFMMIMADTWDKVGRYFDKDNPESTQDQELHHLMFQNAINLAAMTLDGGMGIDTIGEMVAMIDDYKAAQDKSSQLTKTGTKLLSMVLTPSSALVKDLMRIGGALDIVPDVVSVELEEMSDVILNKYGFSFAVANKRYDFFGKTEGDRRGDGGQLLQATTRLRYRAGMNPKLMNELELIRYPFNKKSPIYKEVDLRDIKDEKGQSAYNYFYESLGKQKYGVEEAMLELMETPGYQTLSPYGIEGKQSPRAEAINDKLRNDVYPFAEKRMLEKFPQIQQAVVNRQIEKRDKEREIYTGKESPFNNR